MMNYDSISMPVPPWGTSPTQDESSLIQSLFPNLNANEWKKTGNKTDVTSHAAYNCFAWSLCRDDLGWVYQIIDLLGDNNGVVDVSDFDNFYHSHGYRICGNNISSCKPNKNMRKIALFCNHGMPIHASKEVADDGWWESKIGADIRIIHRLEQMEGDEYGHVCRCYCKYSPNANPSSPEGQPAGLLGRMG